MFKLSPSLEWVWNIVMSMSVCLSVCPTCQRCLLELLFKKLFTNWLRLLISMHSLWLWVCTAAVMLLMQCIRGWSWVVSCWSWCWWYGSLQLYSTQPCRRDGEKPSRPSYRWATDHIGRLTATPLCHSHPHWGLIMFNIGVVCGLH